MKVQERFPPCGTIKWILVLVPRTGAKRRRHLLRQQGRYETADRPRGRILLPSFPCCLLEQLGTLPLLVAAGTAAAVLLHPTLLHWIRFLTSWILKRGGTQRLLRSVSSSLII